MPQVPVPMWTSIDWTSLRATRKKCARLAADEHLAKAATHVSMAKDIMAKAPDYNFTPVSFCVDARIQAAKRLQGFLDSDTEGSHGFPYVDSAPGPRIRPSKAPRLS